MEDRYCSFWLDAVGVNGGGAYCVAQAYNDFSAFVIEPNVFSVPSFDYGDGVEAKTAVEESNFLEFWSCSLLNTRLQYIDLFYIVEDV